MDLAEEFLLRIPGRPAWMDDAACKGMDGDLWFPSSDNMRLRQFQTVAAKAICAECPVKEPCLHYGIANDEDGIWGGLAQGPRRRLALQMSREFV